MKRVVYNILIFCSIAFLIQSCEYREVYDAGSEYPEDKVYIAGVYESVIYKVDAIRETENAPFRYKIDAQNNRLLIPMGVYRGSVWSKKEVTVNLAVSNDTIQGLIESEALVDDDGSVPEILPEGKYTFDEVLHFDKGEDLAITNLSIDIPFLLENLDKRYALGIKIVSSNVDINESKSLIVFDIKAGLIEAQPDFTYEIDEDNPLKIWLTNTSVFCLDYEWDFGDGSPTINEQDPESHEFPTTGRYNVKLTSTGTRGNKVVMTKLVHIWEVITEEFIKNSGNPFVKAGLVSGRVDCLKDWECTENVKTTYNKAKDIYVGGYQGDNGGVMDFYANTATFGALENAKIYQTVALPAGTYNAGFIPYRMDGESNCYFVIYQGNTLPDMEQIESDPNVLGYLHWDETVTLTQQSVEFDVPSDTDVTIGFVVSEPADSRVKIKSVSLAR